MHLVKRDLFFVVYTIATHTHISEKSTCHNCFILLVRQSQHFWWSTKCYILWEWIEINRSSITIVLIAYFKRDTQSLLHSSCRRHLHGIKDRSLICSWSSTDDVFELLDNVRYKPRITFFWWILRIPYSDRIRQASYFQKLNPKNVFNDWWY